MIYAFLTLLSLAAGAVIICCLAWTCGALLFVLALCKSAKLGDDAAKQQNPFRKLKGAPISETRGGNDAAPQLNRCAFLTAGQLSGLKLQ